MILGNMAYVKKISVDQFVFDCIKKEHELAGAEFNFNNFQEFADWSRLDENLEWYNKYELSKEQHLELEKYFIEHFYDCKPKRISRQYVKDKVFPWFCLEYEFPVIRDTNGTN